MKMKNRPEDAGLPTLQEALTSNLNVDDLKRLAALIGQALPTRKPELVSVIVRHLHGDGLHAEWESLDPIQKAAVAEVVHSGSTRLYLDRFQAKYGQGPDWGIQDGYGRIRSPSHLCFFFYGQKVMPNDLKVRLRAFVPPPQVDAVKGFEDLPDAVERPYDAKVPRPGLRSHAPETETVALTVRESESPARRELLAMLRLVDMGRIAVSESTRRPTSTTLAAVTSVLEGGDYYPLITHQGKLNDENGGPMRAFAWPMLLQAAGLAQLSGQKLQLTKAGRKALAEPPERTLRMLWKKWLGSTLLDELSRIECVKGQNGKGKRSLTAVSSRREAVDGVLAACPQGKWVATAEILRFIRSSELDFAVSRNGWDLYIMDANYGALAYEGGEAILDERYLLCLLFEYAATLGLLDVAYIPPVGARCDFEALWGTDDMFFFSRYDGLLFFRVTALGAYCLGMNEDYRPVPVQARRVLRVLPNLDIVIVGPNPEPGDRLALDAYAVHKSDHVWKLDASKLLQAAEAGRSVQEIREFLESRSGEPLPGFAVRFLVEAGERMSRVLDRGLVRLIECADEALAALIANDTRTKKHCRPAGPRHLTVAAESEAAFRRGLRELGYLISVWESPRSGRSKRERTAP